MQAAKSHDVVIIRNCFVNFRVTKVKNALASIQMTAWPPVGEVKGPCYMFFVRLAGPVVLVVSSVWREY